MSSHKVAIINDTHFGVRNGSDIFSTNIEKFFTDTFFPYCIEHGIKDVIHLGDYFDHRKYVNFKTVDASRRSVLSRLAENGMTMTIIPGNHDCYWKNTNELCSLTQLLVHPNVRLVMEPSVIEFSGLPIAFLPWVCDDNREKSMEFIRTCPASILASHLELSGFTMMRGLPIISHGDDKSMFSRFQMVLSGHYHTKSSQDNIHYLGTQFELTWSDCDDPKFFHVLDCSTRELTPVKNPSILFKKIIYDDLTEKSVLEYTKRLTARTGDVSGKFVKLIVISKKDVYQFERFVDTLNAMSPFELKIIESSGDLLMSTDGESDGSLTVDDTPTLLNKYIDAIETDLDKARIKQRIQLLLTEAETTDTV